MAPIRTTPKKINLKAHSNAPISKTQFGLSEAQATLSTQRDIPAGTTVSSTILGPQLPSSSDIQVDTSCTAPQFLQVLADQWTQSLTNRYTKHKRSTRIDLVAQKAVSGMYISRFVQPTRIDSTSGSLLEPEEDLNYSLRRMVAVGPVENANVLYTRIAIKEGRTIAGYAPALPQPRRRRGVSSREEEDFASDEGECGSDSGGGRVKRRPSSWDPHGKDRAMPRH